MTNRTIPRFNPKINFPQPPDWPEYELLDSGNGTKLERFGTFFLNRPEPEAIWKPALPEKEWAKADATFIAGRGEESGQWQFCKQIPDRWWINYKQIKFWLQLSFSRHIGVFPEQAVQWDWILNQSIPANSRPLKVLNLFGYSGIASLAAASTGAQVTHVDASPKAVRWARENQELSGLANAPIRWIVDDALKFVRREIKRGNRYDGLILDPPKFGRGPKGEVWEFYKLLPALLADCCAVLVDDPCFLLLTAYAVKASSLTLLEVIEELMSSFSGTTSAGELLLQEKSAGRYLSKAIFAYWSK
jgi:23S rRNA (cytosine1962-C5)-methyltransferase